MQECKYFESKHFWPKSYLAQTFSNWAYPAVCASSELLRACCFHFLFNFRFYFFHVHFHFLNWGGRRLGRNSTSWPALATWSTGCLVEDFEINWAIWGLTSTLKTIERECQVAASKEPGQVLNLSWTESKAFPGLPMDTTPLKRRCLDTLVS